MLKEERPIEWHWNWPILEKSADLCGSIYIYLCSINISHIRPVSHISSFQLDLQPGASS